ncbi:hypothetical protein JNO63_06175 [Anaerococcus sp. mt242]|uniref:hypothetical protein n=1 Tax=Anaerococcus sp. mt242 TaxID=2661917 RepID=UPI001932198A|nr:hypothetical protein [Anaerococcus sp. mt242]MBM0046674.1 hypothetical protein [Anaerococcus sp. mt242]
MNCHDWEEYRRCLMATKEDRLFSLRKWLETKPNEKERDTKILYIDLEIERREKLRRYYENHIY